MPTLIGLSEGDIKLLRRLTTMIRDQVGSASYTHLTSMRAHQAPDTYLVRTPALGIPAGEVRYCPVLKYLQDQLQVVGMDLLVRNHSHGAVAGGIPLLVTKDKFGKWLSLCCASDAFGSGDGDSGSGSGSGDGTGVVGVPCCGGSSIGSTLLGVIGNSSISCWEGTEWEFTHQGLDGEGNHFWQTPLVERTDCLDEGTPVPSWTLQFRLTCKEGTWHLSHSCQGGGMGGCGNGGGWDV